MGCRECLELQEFDALSQCQACGDAAEDQADFYRELDHGF